MNMVPNYDIMFILYADSSVNKPLRNGQMEPTNTGIGGIRKVRKNTNKNK
jgi:hypothetical protein